MYRTYGTLGITVNHCSTNILPRWGITIQKDKSASGTKYL